MASTQLVTPLPDSHRGRPVTRIPVPGMIDEKKKTFVINSYRYKNMVIVRIFLASQDSAKVIASKIKQATTKEVQEIFQQAVGRRP